MMDDIYGYFGECIFINDIYNYTLIKDDINIKITLNDELIIQIDTDDKKYQYHSEEILLIVEYSKNKTLPKPSCYTCEKEKHINAIIQIINNSCKYNFRCSNGYYFCEKFNLFIDDKQIYYENKKKILLENRKKDAILRMGNNLSTDSMLNLTIENYTFSNNPFRTELIFMLRGNQEYYFKARCDYQIPNIKNNLIGFMNMICSIYDQEFELHFITENKFISYLQDMDRISNHNSNNYIYIFYKSLKELSIKNIVIFKLINFIEDVIILKNWIKLDRYFAFNYNHIDFKYKEQYERIDEKHKNGNIIFKSFSIQPQQNLIPQSNSAQQKQLKLQNPVIKISNIKQLKTDYAKYTEYDSIDETNINKYN